MLCGPRFCLLTDLCRSAHGRGAEIILYCEHRGRGRAPGTPHVLRTAVDPRSAPKMLLGGLTLEVVPDFAHFCTGR